MFKRGCCWLLILSFFAHALAAAPADDATRRQEAQDQAKKGNWKLAYEIFSQLAKQPTTAPDKVSADLEQALQCLHRLNRVEEVDALLEAAIAGHIANWRLLWTAGRAYQNEQFHWGFRVAGEFVRGPKRGGRGEVINSVARDRLRALQLFQQAMPLSEKDGNGKDRANFLLEFAQTLVSGRGQIESWRLQSLSDLTALPDYEDGQGWYRGQQSNGAPVDAAGNPILHEVPKSWEAAIRRPCLRGTGSDS